MEEKARRVAYVIPVRMGYRYVSFSISSFSFVHCSMFSQPVVHRVAVIACRLQKGVIYRCSEQCHVDGLHLVFIFLFLAVSV
jgi:hypothetical protein